MTTTNQSRIEQLERELAQYKAREAEARFHIGMARWVMLSGPGLPLVAVSDLEALFGLRTTSVDEQDYFSKVLAPWDAPSLCNQLGDAWMAHVAPEDRKRGQRKFVYRKDSLNETT